MRVPIPVDATLIASLAWTGHIHLKVEEIAPTESAAADTAESMQSVLTLVKAMDAADQNGPFDPQTRSLLTSINVERHETRVVLTATVPAALLEHWLDTPQELRQAAEPEPAPQTPAPLHEKHVPPQAKPTAPAKVK
jgi:hypothetical protein